MFFKLSSHFPKIASRQHFSINSSSCSSSKIWRIVKSVAFIESLIRWYASAIDLETSNGVEISGLNAEEQSDIAFIANWSQNQASGFVLEVYSYYDAMIILRENNVLELNN